VEKSARSLVADRVEQRARRFPEIYPQRLHTGDLTGRDLALAHAIDQAVARRWITLAAVTQPLLQRSWSRLQASVQAALLTGGAQLLLLERLPDHAVINEAVSWVKRRSPGGAGLVNAVLHRVADLRRERIDDGAPLPRAATDVPLHDGGVLRLAEAVFDGDPASRLGQQTSHPAELLARWVERYGFEQVAGLAGHSLVHPPVIIAGLAGGPSPGLTPHDEPGFAVLDGGRAALEPLLALHPEARVQDPGSAAAVSATAGLVPELIVEVCAGRGTKTRQLAGVHPQAQIVAGDASPHRRADLRRQFRGADRVLVADPEALVEYAGRADLVVVDPPCSNTAVLARRPEAKYRVTPQSLARLLELQRQIIADALGAVAERGHLLYSTCSLEPDENERQIDWIRRWHPLDRLEQITRLPCGAPGDPPNRYRDGCFFALLRRK
jgi:16S rRNA (cytosine967-C5)-methyltransferase